MQLLQGMSVVTVKIFGSTCDTVSVFTVLLRNVDPRSSAYIACIDNTVTQIGGRDRVCEHLRLTVADLNDLTKN